ncbi:MAG: NAD(P)-dependent oxidoreductase [Acidobacteriaceae bacterium]|nr:NAD(P)-dependent oxidoreductase [Acidobacteriaceae bacterium]
MNVVLYGGTGKAGSRILNELLSRGYQVKAVVRDAAKLPQRGGLTTEPGDLSDVDAITRAIRGTDAVISAYAPPMDAVEELVAVTKRLADAVKNATVPRLLVVGGAGSLEVSPNMELVDTPSFPEAWKPIAFAHRGALQVLKSSDINWTYLSPGAFFEPGEHTGKFRLGKDNLIADENGNSRISMEDYAIALVDELEKPEHLCQRFSVGY